MSRKTRISVIVPTYNRANYIGEALSSLLAQTHPVHEIIVWDDGSSDNTAEVVAQYGNRVGYFRASNRGKSAALNLALKEATGDYIWIFDDDDIARPDAAKKLLAAIEANGDKIAAGAFERFSDDTQCGGGGSGGERHTFSAGYWPDLSSGCALRHILEDFFLFQNAMLVHRSCYDDVGPFRDDLARSIDYEMLVRLASRYRVSMIDDVVFAQRQHEGARGPAHARHEASQSMDVWLSQDQTIFRALHRHLPLSLYEAMFDGESRDHFKRAALIQRASVYCRRHLWELALDDLERAARILPDVALADVEWDACLRSMAGKYWNDAVFLPNVRHRLRAIRRESRAGDALVKGLARGMLWRARRAAQTGDIMEVARIARFAGAVGGPSALVRGLRSGVSGGALRERRVLPDSAYLW